MARGNNDGSGSGIGSEMAFVAFIIVVAGALFFAWYYMKEHIVLASYFYDRVQILIWERVYGLGERGHAYLDYLNSFFDGRRLAKDEQFSQFVHISTVLGEVTRIPLTLAVFAMAVLVYFKMKGEGFKGSLSLVGFANYQAEHWGTLAPSARFNPDVDDEATAPSKTPSEWMHSLGLKVHLENGLLSEKSRKICEKAFITQLGLGWGPLARMPLHVRVLFAMFVAHGSKMKNSYNLRQDIARTYADIHDPKKRDAALELLIKDILANEKACKPFLEVAEKHAYIPTAMLALLRDVRKRQGVLPSAEFTWLKKIDRNLWYPLNNVGRRAFHIEAAGAFSHYFYENVSRRPQSEPRIDNAILGLEDYINHHGIDEPDE